MNEKIDFVFNGDCRELISKYPDNFFDCVVSDVPYQIATGGARVSEESIEKFGKNDPQGIFKRTVCNDRIKSKWLKQNDKDTALLVAEGKLFKYCDIKFEEWLPEVFRVLKNGSHAYFMVNSRNLNELETKAKEVGFQFQNLLVWVKNNATPNKYYMQKCEFILFMRKGPAKNINDMGKTNVFCIPNIIGKKFHPTEKPVELMKEFILQSTKEGDIVLEPFCGSGATVLAAKQLNRHFVASELDEEYCQITNKRLEGTAQRNQQIENDKQQIKLF